MYNPATSNYSTNWVYMRVTGEIGVGQPGKTGLWYCYAGVWDDNGNGDVSSSSGGVKNTERVGYYVKYGNNFYMNIKEGEANTNVPSTAPNSGWVEMQSDFKYIITKAVFSDYAQLGSFIINGDWFISIEGKKNGSWSKDYTKFDPSSPDTSVSGKHTVNGETWYGYNFVPNVAIDAKTGKTYFNDTSIRGNINATSGSITGNINVGTSGNKMQIYADENRATGYYSGIRGTSNNDNVFDLGFNTQNGYTNIFMNMIGTMPFAGREMICVVRPYEIVFQDHGNSWAQIGYSYDTRSGKMLFRLSASPSIWPTEGVDDISALPLGTVYLRDDSCLGVTR